MRQNLPEVDGHFEIDGDAIRPLDHCPEPPEPEPVDDDSENLDDLIDGLPLLDIDPTMHFLKRGKYRSEIENLLKCQGGSCPGEPISHNIIRLLGKSQSGDLVFEKLRECYYVSQVSTLHRFKRWILDMIDALTCLHSLGIVHRDLHISNCLFSNDGKQLVVCDLESRWGSYCPPEIATDTPADEAGWTIKSDIYCIGECIQSMIYSNRKPHKYVEWPVPAPLDAIVKACMQNAPEERPSLGELRAMVESITTEADNEEDEEAHVGRM
ncbi:kinase-like domain-containing protein [Nemania serpens]|nr:kinase-like domain-containing protein [Nemania serpens]